MPSEKYYKSLFIVGAIWNIGAALPLLVVSFFTDSIYSIFGMEKPNVMIWMYFSFLCIILYGIGYFLVSKDLTKNQAIVLFGIIGKVGFFVLTLSTFIQGQANFLLLSTGVVDFIFTILFSEFLVRQMKK